MKKVFLILSFASVALQMLAWGQKGHDVTAYIAEQHLTPATAAAVDSLLAGKSMVYWSNWLDNAVHTPEYAYAKTWHYRNVDADETYETAAVNPEGDCVTACKAQVETLRSDSTTYDRKALALKMLVHIVGDMHQPMHMGRLSDRGGNNIKVKYFDRDTNLHSVWDGSLPEAAHKWSYTEWQQQLDRASEAEQAEIEAGSFDDWARQTYGIAGECYVYFQPGCKIMYNEIARWTPVIEQQFLRGGLRLAHVLNTIFDPTYTAPAQ